jgi:hypothetical protein
VPVRRASNVLPFSRTRIARKTICSAATFSEALLAAARSALGSAADGGVFGGSGRGASMPRLVVSSGAQ